MIPELAAHDLEGLFSIPATDEVSPTNPEAKRRLESGKLEALGMASKGPWWCPLEFESTSVCVCAGSACEPFQRHEHLHTEPEQLQTMTTCGSMCTSSMPAWTTQKSNYHAATCRLRVVSLSSPAWSRTVCQGHSRRKVQLSCPLFS